MTGPRARYAGEDPGHRIGLRLPRGASRSRRRARDRQRSASAVPTSVATSTDGGAEPASRSERSLRRGVGFRSGRPPRRQRRRCTSGSPSWSFKRATISGASKLSSCRQTASGTATRSSPRVKRRGTARDPIRSPSASRPELADTPGIGGGVEARRRERRRQDLTQAQNHRSSRSTRSPALTTLDIVWHMRDLYKMRDGGRGTPDRGQTGWAPAATSPAARRKASRKRTLRRQQASRKRTRRRENEGRPGMRRSDRRPQQKGGCEWRLPRSRLGRDGGASRSNGASLAHPREAESIRSRAPAGNAGSGAAP